MKITPQLFEAFLKCPTKCWLIHADSSQTNSGSNWATAEQENFVQWARYEYRRTTSKQSCVSQPPQGFQYENWDVAVDVCVPVENLEVTIPLVERNESSGPAKPNQLVPVRFLSRRKVTKEDKLLIALDAYALSCVVGEEIKAGRIVHGPTCAVSRVNTIALRDQVQQNLQAIEASVTSTTPPDLVLNSHCSTCEFRELCRKKAVDNDDLSLLSAMGAEERKAFHNKGIFTINQLSHTFRPRRRPKRFCNKLERYHHSLKALAIREKKIHIVGDTDLLIGEGATVFLDIEGLPDEQTYYLIGAHVCTKDGSVAEHSLWADSPKEEERIWSEFLALVETLEGCKIVHYGSYETAFFKRMRLRYEEVTSKFPGAVKAMEQSLNVLSWIYGRVYFPTFSNGLKEVAGYLGFKWSEPEIDGAQTIEMRHQWEKSPEPLLKQSLVRYNSEDCFALTKLVGALLSLPKKENRPNSTDRLIHVDDLPREGWGRLGKVNFQLPELDEINKAAYWDHQQSSVFLKTSERLKPKQRKQSRAPSLRTNKVVVWPPLSKCPTCGNENIYKHLADNKILYDLRFYKSGPRKWITKYLFYRYRCLRCRKVFHNSHRAWTREKYGHNLCAFAVYLIVQLRLSQSAAANLINRMFGFGFSSTTVNHLKIAASKIYEATYRSVLQRIVSGPLVHADETTIDFKSQRGYVWVFTDLNQVAFVFSQSREAQTARVVLEAFGGVLVSDFYTGYDNISCPKQRCLIHLIRDLNDDLQAEPFNEELKALITKFTNIVKPIIDTADEYGLKAKFLRSHLPAVKEFYAYLSNLKLQTETAKKCQARLKKNEDSLFTFLNYDGVPWNNNNAEHAIKSFALIRRLIKGVTTEKGIKEYLVLLSICESCKYMGIDFLEFLLSGKKDLHAFAAAH